MSDLDGLIQMACAAPADATRRGALADALTETNETECAEALRSDAGEEVVRTVWKVADCAQRTPCLHILWAVVVLKVGAPVDLSMLPDHLQAPVAPAPYVLPEPIPWIPPGERPIFDRWPWKTNRADSTQWYEDDDGSGR